MLGGAREFSLVGKRVYRCDVISVVGMGNSVPSAPAPFLLIRLGEREREKKKE